MHTAESPDGMVTFQGKLEGPELALVIETGLNELMKHGLVPFISTETFDLASVHEVPDMDQ